MLSEERKDRILEILEQKKYASTNKLSQDLFCSVATVRRELIELENKGLVKRYHGGVSLIPQTNMELPRVFREKEAQEEKIYISDLATLFITNGQAIFLDASSTVNTLCSYLENYSNLKVITNGIKTALDLSMLSNLSSFFAGGKINLYSNATVGEMTNVFLTNFKMDIAFISCRGIDENGLYEADYEQAEVKKHMILNSDKTIVLCDDSKFEKSHFYKLAPFEKIHTVISNKPPKKSIIKNIELAGSDITW